LEKSLD